MLASQSSRCSSQKFWIDWLFQIGIPLPARGYWARLQHGRQDPKPEIEFENHKPLIQLPDETAAESREQMSLMRKLSKKAAEEVAPVITVKDQKFDFQQLEELTEKLANYYHLKGFPFASVSLPTQDLKAGDLKIEIIEGRYGTVASSGEFLSEDASPFLESLKPGEVIEAKVLERTMLIIDDLPMISVSPTVSPGQNFGTDTSNRNPRLWDSATYKF